MKECVMELYALSLAGCVGFINYKLILVRSLSPRDKFLHPFPAFLIRPIHELFIVEMIKNNYGT
jgi:hypothetical protein